MGSAAENGSARLVPRRLGRAAVVVIAAGALLVAVLAAIFHGQHGYNGLDSWVLDDLLAPLQAHRHALWQLVRFGSPTSVVVIAASLAVVACLMRNWRGALLAVVGPGLTGLAVETLKHLIGRTLFGDVAMPSGHTAGATTVAVVVAVLVLSRVRHRLVGAGVAALVAVTAVAAAAGATMTALQLHYATDTVAGWGAGLAGTLTAALVIDAVADRIRVPRLASAP